MCITVVFELFVSIFKLLAPAALTCSVALFIASKFLAQHVEKENWGLKRGKFEEICAAVFDASEQAKTLSALLDQEGSDQWDLNRERRAKATEAFLSTRRRIKMLELLYTHLLLPDTQSSLHDLSIAFDEVDKSRREGSPLKDMVKQLADHYSKCVKQMVASGVKYYTTPPSKFVDFFPGIFR